MYVYILLIKIKMFFIEWKIEVVNSRVEKRI